jgi:hypothetical protein
MHVGNLNDIVPDGGSSEHERVKSAISQDGGVKVFFDGLEDALIEQVKQADAVLGVVAWLTSQRILDALALKEVVSIVVQKEDFLRPDLYSTPNRRAWAHQLREMYERLKCDIGRYWIPYIGEMLSTNGDWGVQAVRCVGNYNRSQAPAFPRAHHKFVTFCRWEYVEELGRGIDPADSQIEEGEQEIETLVPYAVWTGSYNFTENASKSLENALLITHPEIVHAFLVEYGHILALSEPLDWESDWLAPEWRIGT